ncbi:MULTISPECIES: class III lanthipeptide [unclassified Streptomyces]|nr:class III lanthipeptide [Streptomyces sp. NRRL F-2747]
MSILNLQQLELTEEEGAALLASAISYACHGTLA